MKAGKLIKRFFLLIFVLIVLVVGAAVAIPIFFKEELVNLAKTQINQQLNATVDFDEDIKLSIFKSFPDLSLQIKDLSVTGKDQFDKYELAKLSALDFELDIMSVIKSEKPIQIKSVRLVDADIKVLVLEDGTANYDIALASADTSTSSSASADFNIALESYEIRNSNIAYIDKQTGTNLEIIGLDHSGSGDFTSTEYDLSTKTDMESLTFRDGSMRYLVDATTAAKIVININNSEAKYTFKDNSIKVNDLELVLDGWLQQKGSAYDMDLFFKTPSTSFKSIWSLIPYAYTKDYRNVKADGIMSLSGLVKGKYDENTYPAFKASLSVSNGQVKYPDLPLGINDVQAKVDVNSPTSNLDDMTIQIPQFHIDLGGNPFDATLTLKRPLSDPDIKTSIDGKLDLGKLAQAFPIEGIENLNGQVDAKLDIDTRMSYVEREAYDKVKMNGQLTVQNVNVVSPDYPDIKIQKIETEFAPQFVDLQSFKAQLGRSDVEASGRLDNLLAYFSPDLTMKGALKVRGTLLDANEWLPEETDEPTASAEPTASDAGFDRFDFALDAQIDQILYEDYVLKGTKAKGSFSPSRVQLDNFETKIDDSDLKVSGRLENVYDYLFDNQTITGQVDLYSSNLDINQLYSAEAVQTTESTDTPEELAESIPVPGNIDLLINADLDKLKYDKLTFRDMSGRVTVRDSKVSLDRFNANGLGGDFFLKGFYDTSDPEKPSFDIQYDLSKLNVIQAVEALSSIKTLAPIMSYVEGLLSSNLQLSGSLNKDLSIDYASLAGKGNVETFNTLVKNFEPLRKVGEKLNLENEFSDIKVEDTRNWFDISDGKLALQEDDIKFNDMVVNVSGSHGLVSQEMDYLLKFDIPKSKLTKNPIGQSADRGLNLLQGQASKLGLNINEGENVKFNVKVTGSISDPKIKVNLVGVDGNTVKEEVVTAVKEEVKERVEGQVLESIQEQTGMEAGSVQELVDETKDKATEALEEKADEVKEEVAETVKENIKESLGEKIDSSVIGDKAKESLKDIKNKIKLPFGKKKKDDND